jgi:hypothetical protein
MAIRKPIAVALSTVALAGITAVTSGAATPASAQTMSATSQQQVAFRGCWRWDNCHRWHRWHHHDHGNRWNGGWGGW